MGTHTTFRVCFSAFSKLFAINMNFKILNMNLEKGKKTKCYGENNLLTHFFKL